MTEQLHPIVPPLELVRQWLSEFYDSPTAPGESTIHIATRAAQWGAEQELEACLCEISFLGSKSLSDRVRSTRRPKPPTLKEQALEALKDLGKELPIQLTSQYGTVLHALEQLND